MSSPIARTRRTAPASHLSSPRPAASRATLSAALAAVLMTGCALSPTPLSVTESQVFGADKGRVRNAQVSAGAKARPAAETAQPASWQPTLAVPPRT